jgi:hypothetical protein
MAVGIGKEKQKLYTFFYMVFRSPIYDERCFIFQASVTDIGFLIQDALLNLLQNGILPSKKDTKDNQSKYNKV